ncbi:MAG: hypothetical protein NTX50_22905, partial [Candidatus Sumerlaeota bacterium]|nr:hypothetical protein [Candidatus Sumerlaeota bacterium]
SAAIAIYALALWLVCAECGAQAQPAPAPAAQPVFILKTALQKSVILTGEPVFIRLHATCVSRQSSEFATQPYWGASVHAMIASANAPEFRYTGLSDAAARPEVVYDFDPGETREIRVLDHAICYKERDDFSPEGFVFAQPGEARIKLEWSFRDLSGEKVLRPEPFALRIEAPRAPADVKTWEAIQGDKALALALQNGVCDAAAAPKIEALLKTYPDSAYAPYLRVAWLGELAFQEAGGTAAQLQQRLRQGLAESVVIEARAPDFFLMDEVIYRRALCYDRLGDPGKAMDQIMEMMERYPYSSRVVKVHKFMRRYVLRLREGGDPAYLWTLCEK